MALLHNKIQAQQMVRIACEDHHATAPYFHEPQGTEQDPKSEYMEIHLTTNVNKEYHSALIRRLQLISEQSDDVNKMAILQEDQDPIWNITIYVGRPKPQEPKAP